MAKKAVAKIKLTVPTQKGDMNCPCHGKPVALHHRWNSDEDRYGGSCYLCPEYAECGYYVSGDLQTRAATDGNGIALGRLVKKDGRRKRS